LGTPQFKIACAAFWQELIADLDQTSWVMVGWKSSGNGNSFLLQALHLAG